MGTKGRAARQHPEGEPDPGLLPTPHRSVLRFWRFLPAAFSSLSSVRGFGQRSNRGGRVMCGAWFRRDGFIGKFRSFSVRSLILAAALLPGAAPYAQQHDLPGAPQLRINDPFAAPIWRIDVDARETFVVSGSADKAATVWSLEDAEKADIHRVPLRKEERQRAHAVAISPNGKLIAYGVPPRAGKDGWPETGTGLIYVLKRINGEIIHRIADLPTRAQALRFSPDGVYLAATLSNGCGLRVWAVANWSLVGADDVDYGGGETPGDLCRSAGPRERDGLPDTPGLAFHPSGEGGVWLITAGDTGIRTYQRKGDGIALSLHKRPERLGVERPDGIAISPDGTRLAIGDRRHRGRKEPIRLQVKLFDLATLEPVGAPLSVDGDALMHPAFLDPQQVPGADQMSLNRLAWGEAEGEEWLFAGGTLWCQIAARKHIIGSREAGELDICIVRWPIAKSGNGSKKPEVKFIPVGTDRVMDLAFLGGKQALLFASVKQLGAIDMSGNPLEMDEGSEFLHRSLIADFRNRLIDASTGKWTNLGISDDGKTVYYEDYRSSDRATIRLKFDLDQLHLSKVGERPEGIKSPNQDPILLEEPSAWRNAQRAPVIYEMPLEELSGVYDTYRAVALGPGQSALIGSSNFIRLVGYEGGAAKVLCEQRVAAEAFRVNITPDGSVAVAAHSDGTLRWYRIIKRDDGSGCIFDHALSLHIREVEWGTNQWTWTAWRPETGEFAADARAKSLVGWQVTDSNGQPRTVPFRKLLNLYNRGNVRSALEQPAETPKRYEQLKSAVAQEFDPLTVTVTAPEELTSVKIPALTVALEIKGEGAWPRMLRVETGSGVRARTRFRGQAFGPGDPIALMGPGSITLDVDIPAEARKARRNFHICFHLDRSRTCHTLDWAGAIEKPAKRRLWAILVGFSDYGTEGLNLDYAQNDALDLAKLFVDDHRRRVVDKTSDIAPDYDEIHVDLVLAPSSPTAKDELAKLEKLPFVERRPASIEGIVSALTRLVERDRSEELSNDLLVFYFSGHGLVHPYNRDKGRTALLSPDFQGDLSRESLARAALSSDTLLELLSRVSAEKIIILDACRTTAALPTEIPFDPGIVNKEFEERVLSAHFFFSAKAGQFSLDQNLYAFSKDRPARARGNGIFTYALLSALTSRKADIAGSTAGRNKIEVWEIGRYLEGFFDPEDRSSAAAKLISRLEALGHHVILQEPVFVPARRSRAATSVVRSLE